jgi:hypothetical protein
VKISMWRRMAGKRACKTIAHRGCTRGTETIRMQKNKKRLLLLRVIKGVEGGSVQQLKGTEEEWCIEGIWCTEHKMQKNINRKEGVQEDTDAGREEQCSRTMMRPVSH